MIPEVKIGLIGGIGTVLVLSATLWGCPQYSVYEQRLAGEAELARAEYKKRGIDLIALLCPLI